MGKKLVFVDNNPLFLKFMVHAFEDQGYSVRTAETGLEALEVIERHAPKAVITDLVMPNISGGKLCRILRDDPHFAGVFLVLLSATAAEVEANPAVEYGADLCIAKGGLKNTAAKILEALKGFEQGTYTDVCPKEVVGVEDLFRREITAELVDREKIFDVILANITEGVVQLSEDGRIVYANEAALAFFGLPEERVLASQLASYLQGLSGRVAEDICKVVVRQNVPADIDTVHLNNGADLHFRIIPAGNGCATGSLVIMSSGRELKRKAVSLGDRVKHLMESFSEKTAS